MTELDEMKLEMLERFFTARIYKEKGFLGISVRVPGITLYFHKKKKGFVLVAFTTHAEDPLFPGCQRSYSLLSKRLTKKQANHFGFFGDDRRDHQEFLIEFNRVLKCYNYNMNLSEENQ